MELAILNGTYRDTNIKARKQIHALLTLVLFLIAKVTISAQKSPHLDVSSVSLRHVHAHSLHLSTSSCPLLKAVPNTSCMM